MGNVSSKIYLWHAATPINIIGVFKRWLNIRLEIISYQKSSVTQLVLFKYITHNVVCDYNMLYVTLWVAELCVSVPTYHRYIGNNRANFRTHKRIPKFSNLAVPLSYYFLTILLHTAVFAENTAVTMSLRQLDENQV